MKFVACVHQIFNQFVSLILPIQVTAIMFAMYVHPLFPLYLVYSHHIKVVLLNSCLNYLEIHPHFTIIPFQSNISEEI